MTELTWAELAELAETFGLGALEASERIESGTVNSNYWIEAGGRRWFVRVNEGKRAADIDYEVALVDALRAAGVSTPAIIATRAGDRAVWRRDRPVMIFEWIAGEHREPAAITAGDVEQVAAELAAVHRATAGFPLRRAGIYRTADIAARFATFRDSADPRLAPAIELIDDELDFLAGHAASRAELATAVIHQDLFPDNVLFHPEARPVLIGAPEGSEGASSRPGFAGSGRPVLIDFEQAADGARLYDLAVLVNAWCFDAGEPDPRRLAAAVGGYGGLEARPEDLWIELRAAAVRFAVTRITDVYLPGLSRSGKDFGEYTDRLVRWRQIGAGGLAAML